MRKPSKQDDEDSVIFHYSADAPKKRVDSPLIFVNGVNSSTNNNGTVPNRARAETSTESHIVEQRTRAATELGHLERQRPVSIVMSPNNLQKRGFYTLTKNLFSKHNDHLDEKASSLNNENVKRSWFLGSLFHVDTGDLELHKIKFVDRSFAQIKADLIHSILLMPKAMHTPLSNTQFKLEYKKKKGKSWLRVASHHPITALDIKISKKEAEDGDGDKPSEVVVTFAFLSGSHRKFGKICQKLSSSINERGKKRESRSKFSSSSDALISSASSEYTTYERNSISSNRKTSSIKDIDEESQKESFTPRISDPQDNENNLFTNGDFSSSSDLLDSSNSSIEIEEGKMYETDDSITDQQIAENSLKTTIL